MPEPPPRHRSQRPTPPPHDAGQPGADTLDGAPAILTPHFEAAPSPGPQVLGYAASLALTFGAAALAIRRVLPPAPLMALLLALAAGQAALQLGCFMHLRESRGPAWQLPVVGLGFVIALGVVVASIWIMTFKAGVS